MERIKAHSAVDSEVVKTLLYFDIFRYPLKRDEVFRFLGTNGTDVGEVHQVLDQLVDAHRVYRFGEFYSVENNEANVARRVRGNAEATRVLPKAYRQSRLIARFPFVRAVMISGSLSKGFMDDKSDFDFFIVTAPGRLWIARTLLVMYKRLFLFNSHRYFCVNYFLDQDHLEIEEKNLFTATELATLIPTTGYTVYQNLIASNPWVRKTFPNFQAVVTNESLRPENPSRVRTILEWIAEPAANFLNQSFMNLTVRRWTRLYGKAYDASDFNIAFKSKPHVSKNHPNHYQKRIMNCFHDKVKHFNETNEGVLQP